MFLGELQIGEARHADSIPFVGSCNNGSRTNDNNKTWTVVTIVLVDAQNVKATTIFYYFLLQTIETMSTSDLFVFGKLTCRVKMIQANRSPSESS